MSQETNPNPPSAAEDEGILVTAIMRGTAALTDAQVLAVLLQEQTPSRAEGILREAGSLDLIQSMGPLELAALGLSSEEITRIMVVLEFATRAIRRDRRRKLGSMEGTVREIRLRALAWPRSVIGIIGVDTYNRVILDKVMHEGIEQWVPIDLQGLLRECLRAGCNALVVYRWSPRPERLVAAEDIRISDDLRVLGSILGISLIDFLVIGEQSFYTGRGDSGWVE